MQFSEIFEEYFVQFRGQASSIPTYPDREFKTAIGLGNAGIRTWDRVDGQIWRELIVTAGEQSTDVWASNNRTVTGTTLTPPNNMRKPPAFVQFSNGVSSFEITVVPPQEQKDYSDQSSTIWFEGGANTGFVMHISDLIAQQYNGWTINYVYVKKPTLLSTTQDPSTTVVEMSDPNFLIQDMLRRRFRSGRNGFGYKTADADCKTALLNMKIENDSGVWGNSDRMRDLLINGQGWGTNQPINDIRL